MDAIKCPNCGGLTTNYLNCDYCGSYLVRFSKRNVKYDDTQLGKDARIIRGIQEELQANINEQIETHAKNHICSKTKNGYFDIEVRNPRSIGDLVKKTFGDTIHTVTPQNPFDENEIAIILVIRVYEFSKSYVKGLSDNEKMRQLYEKQKTDWLEYTGMLGICIKSDDSILSIDGRTGICHSYYINFGKDTTGATRALSSLIFGINNEDIKNVSFTRSSSSEIQYQASLRKLKDEKKIELKERIIAALIFYIVYAIFMFFKFETNGVFKDLFWFFIASLMIPLFLLAIYILKYTTETRRQKRHNLY